jgi:hypothetical protein
MPELYLWEDSIPEFFTWVEEVCGIHKESEIYKSLKGTMSTMRDLDIFIELFDGDFCRIERTVVKYLAKRHNF